MKKLLSILIALVLVLSCLPVLAETTTEEAAPTSITIFHTNDVHGRYDASAGMGYAMAASFINEAREAGENVLVLDAGDTFHGTIFATATRGESIGKIMDLMGYAAMTAGNHDFNYGKERLLELAKLNQFPILSSNLLNEDGSYLLTPYTIVEVADKKIAIVGAQNPEIKSSIHPDYTDDILFEGAEQVAKVVAEVEPISDAVIILCHWGCSDAYDPNSSVLAAIPGVDLVIDGHSHTPLPEIKQIEGSAAITSTGEYLNNLGRVVMTFAPEGIEIEPSLIPNPGRIEDHALLNDIEVIEAAQAGVLDTVIGKAAIDLIGEREIVRTQESNWGDFACDVFLQTTGADVAIMNGGNIRKTVPAGDITVRDINEVYPFGNYVCVISLTGETLLAALEHGFSNLPETSGGFPQVGGMTMTVDATKEVGNRVSDLKIGGEPVDLEKTYQLVTNDYLASGGDSYAMLAECPLLLEMGFMDEVIMDHIQEIGTVAQDIDGRLNIIK